MLSEGTTTSTFGGRAPPNVSVGLPRATTIWNFSQATSLTIDRNFNGAILAPSAHLTNSTAIDGSVFVASMTQNGEVHLPGYTGVVPAPGTAVLAGLGGLIMAARRR
jgi:choice-of-anchor A domain-containing protein